MVIGVMLLGICTPTEAAATGVLACLILTAFYGKLKWKMLKDSFEKTARLTVMVLMIVISSTAFSQMLAFSQASKGLTYFSIGLDLSPILIVVSMQIVLLFLGCFMDAFSIMMITIPIYFPIIQALGMSELWFAVLMLLNIEIAPITPPFGLELFVMKGVTSSDTTMMDIYRSAIPFLILDIILLGFLLFCPEVALWLPGLM
jgi:tripartite ATP-independent transporter DctM subunit